jgi:hypothetical protein
MESLDEEEKNIVLFLNNPSYIYMGLNRKKLQNFMERYLLHITIRSNRNPY